jgi:hypothetical protein
MALRDGGQIACGPSTVTTASISTTLPPADDVARLTARDNLGSVSQVAMRGFSIK